MRLSLISQPVLGGNTAVVHIMFAYFREQDKNIPQVFPGITSALVG